uniref:hypothetical protein n=1 Tax=Rhodococcus marinonascens TaxID=38311 RepID=UPI001472F7FD|nr:hypothetical protein [Rhodococcus marinonascens]
MARSPVFLQAKLTLEGLVDRFDPLLHPAEVAVLVGMWWASKNSLVQDQETGAVSSLSSQRISEYASWE